MEYGYLEIPEDIKIKAKLYEISKSDNKVKSESGFTEERYLLPETENLEVYNFDKIVELVCKEYRHNKKTNSADAFFITKDNQFFLIEFKNTIKNHMPKKELFYKAYDSILPIQLLFCHNQSLDELRDKLTYIVVYNNHANLPENEKENASPAFEEFGKKMREMAKIPESLREIYWGLEIYKGVLFKEIYTVDKQDFLENIKPLFQE